MGLGRLEQVLNSLPSTSVDNRGGSTSNSITSIADRQGESETSSYSSKAASSTRTSRKIISTSTSRNRYKLFRIPQNEDLCYNLIGQGVFFCLNSRCTTAHQNPRKHFPVPNELYVSRNISSAFISPSISGHLLSQELQQNLLSTTKTLDEWEDVFNAAQQVELDDTDDPTISSEALNSERENISKKLAFKTPRKRQASSISDIETLPPPFKKFSEKYTDDSEMELLEMIKDLDERSRLLLNSLRSFHAKRQDDIELNLQCHDSNETKISKLSSSVGNKPPDLDTNIDAPNLWLTLANIATYVNEFSSRYSQQTTNIHSQLSELNRDKASDINTKDTFRKISSKFREIDSFLESFARNVNEKIDHIGHSLTPAAPTSPIDENFKIRLKNLEEDVNQMKAATDDRAIKFCSLGFKSLRECTAWLEIHSPGTDFGILNDYHMVMEHVFILITGINLNATLEKIYKMKLSTPNQGVALSSFELRVPKFFSGNPKNIGIVKRDESYFLSIKSWDEWDTPRDGHRDKLKDMLSHFAFGHQRDVIDTQLIPNSLIHTVATTALTTSVTWAKDLINFVDNTYNEYYRAGYSSKTAWNLTTRLATSLQHYISVPRYTVYNSFRISNPASIAVSMFYASLQSLDRMHAISSVNFKNSTVITAELTKFLVMTSNHDSVSGAVSKIKVLESTMDKLKRDLQSVEKTAVGLGNNFDSKCKQPLEDLRRRVKKLEDSNRN